MTKLLRAFCLGCWALGLALPAPALAQAATQVRFNPSTGQVALNQTLAVSVEIVGVTDLYGLDITVTFDPAVVEVVDAYPAVANVQIAQGTFLDPGFVIINEADNGAGTIHFAMTQLNPSPAKSGTGSLLVITLRGKQANAQSALTLVDVQLASRTGTAIAATAVNGQVQVLAEPVPGASNTPVPTVGSGTVFPGAATETSAAPTTIPATAGGPSATVTTAPGQPSATPAAVATQPASAGTAPPKPASPTLAPAQATAAQQATAAASPASGEAVSEATAQPSGGEVAGQPGATDTPWVMANLPTRTEIGPTQQAAGRTPPPVDGGTGGQTPSGTGGSLPTGSGLTLLAGAAAVVVAGLVFFSIRRRGARR